MKRFQLIVNRLLIGWGLLCAGIALVLAIAFAYQFGPGKVSAKTASQRDLRYVLNWCELGDEVSGVLDDALGFVKEWISPEELSWFITEQEMRSLDVYIYPWSIYYHGTSPTAVKLIFVRPVDNTVFYFAAKS